jgi:hypothetical protein
MKGKDMTGEKVDKGFDDEVSPFLRAMYIGKKMMIMSEKDFSQGANIKFGQKVHVDEVSKIVGLVNTIFRDEGGYALPYENDDDMVTLWLHLDDRFVDLQLENWVFDCEFGVKLVHPAGFVIEFHSRKWYVTTKARGTDGAWRRYDSLLNAMMVMDAVLSIEHVRSSAQKV